MGRVDSYISKKVRVKLSRGKSIERVLREDSQGLYIRFENERVSVRPALNSFNEAISGCFIGLHPKDEANIQKRRKDVAEKVEVLETRPAEDKQSRVIEEIENSFDTEHIELESFPALPYGMKVIDKLGQHMVFFYDFFQDAVAHIFPDAPTRASP